MRFLTVFCLIVLLSGCSSCTNCTENDNIYQPTTEPDYVPPSQEVFNAAGFEIKEGQQIKSFFSDFKEPMHAEYIGKDVIRWTYYIDYDKTSGKGTIVRYCELEQYQPHSLCNLTVDFYKTYVANAYSDCR